MEVPDTACRTMSQMSVHSDSNSLPSENNSNFQDIIEVTLMNSTEHESNYNDHEYMCSDGAKGKWFEILWNDLELYDLKVVNNSSLPLAISHFRTASQKTTATSQEHAM